MMTSRRILAGMLGVLILTGCDNSSTNLSQADQQELGTLRTEKKTWESHELRTFISKIEFTKLTMDTR